MALNSIPGHGTPVVIIDTNDSPLGTSGNPLTVSTVGGGSNVTIASPIGQTNNASSVSVTVSSDLIDTNAAVQGVRVYIADPGTGSDITYSSPTNTYPYGRTALGSQTTSAITDTTVTTIVTANATHQNDLIGLIFSNSGTATSVTIKDDTTTRATFYCPATDTRGIVFAGPFLQAAVNKNWTATCTGTPTLIVTSQFVVN